MSEKLDFLSKISDNFLRRRDHTAVEAPDGNFTYEQFNKLSNQLSNRLISLGVQRESRVGISLHRGARELSAIFATVKSGGAYIPLDPWHPIDRLRAIIEESNPQVVILHSDSELSTGLDCECIVLDEFDEATDGFAADLPPIEYEPEQLQYILFTSGSTGKPKGVEIPRRAFTNFLRSMAHTPGLSEHERLLAITTSSFDLSKLDLYLPFYVGATIVITDRETARDPRLLRRRLENDRISLMQATPATWRLLWEAGWRGDGTLRMVCGGEPMSPALADRLLSAGKELWNAYGPTETTVWSSLEKMQVGYDRITVGRPIDETQIYILDEEMKRVPVEREGEIWIGGSGLARGYCGQPELTAERFVQNPFGQPGERIYRTGDLGRQLADGRLECLGRIDHQVKIRGFRIELEEIETILREVAEVAEALVVADRREDGEPRLIAYWVGDANREALVEHASRKLPSYMVPAAFVPLRAFPLNANGKIDRKRLPKPETIQSESVTVRLPRSDTETRIAAIWCDVLGLRQVPVDESFFTLGGTSTLAFQVVSRIGQEMGIDIPLKAVFENPTVEGIAANLGKSFSPDDPIVVWLQRGMQDRAPLFCLFGVNLYQELAMALHRDWSVVGMHVPFRYVPGRDQRPRIREVGRRYVQLVRKYQEHGPYFLLGLCFGGVVAYEVADQLESMGESVAALVIIDAVLPTAVHIDQIERIRSYAQRSWNEPKKIGRWLRDNREKIVTRIPILKDVGLLNRENGNAKAIDLPVDGPEVETEIREFASRFKRLTCPLLVVRATEQVTPTWMRIDKEQGWQGRASKVVVKDIAGGHLAVLRAPHVYSLAQAVSELTPPS